MKGLLQEANTLKEQIIADRRRIHQNPETGMDLPNTVAFIKARLKEMGIEGKDCHLDIDQENRDKFMNAGLPDAEVATGVVAVIGSGSPCILLRADIDALPIQEINDLDFKAQNGAGHMCGHDSHGAMLLGAAKLLKAHEKELKGTVKLLFQPGEEWGCGSKYMVAAGALENPKVDAAVGMHIMSDREAGEVSYVKGVCSAAMDTFVLKVTGKGGHSSMPQTAIDPLMIMNQVYQSINLLVGREIDPRETVALTVGKCGGGTAVNVIPDTAELAVGVRTFNREVRALLGERIPEMTDHIVKAWRGTYELSRLSTPSTFNDDQLCDQLVPYLTEIAGEGNVKEDRMPMAGTEDFGYISEQVPGMYYILGGGGPGSYPMHNPHMVLDESVFPIGSALLANCAMEWLTHNV